MVSLSDLQRSLLHLASIAHCSCTHSAALPARLSARLPNSAPHAAGEIDREALGALVFADSAQRRRLNAATHPAVGLELARTILLSWLLFLPVAVVDMPLLFESGFARLTHPNVLVACTPETQRERLMQRDALERAAADARIASQMPLEAKRRRAHVVLQNDGSAEELRRQVELLVAALRRRAWVHRWLLSPVGLLAAAAAAVALWPR